MRNRLFNLFASNAKKGSIRAEGNVIYIYDFIVGSDLEAEWFGGVSAGNFAKLLAGMSGPVDLHVNSPGGEVFAGIAIAQAIRSYTDKVTVHVDGIAASIASIIAISGNEVIMAPGSFMMIHRAWTIAWGNSVDLAKEAETLAKVDGSLADQYVAKAGDKTDWLAAMDTESWYTADEAVELGLADRVAAAASDAGDEPAQDRADWDLSAFANAPVLPTNVAQVPPAAEAEPVAEPVSEPVTSTDNSPEIAARQRRLTVALLKPPA